MAHIYYDNDADLSVLNGKTVCIVGYGSQGHAHAQNLRDSGVSVIIGYPNANEPKVQARSTTLRQAISDGFEVVDVKDGVRRSQVVMILAPDETQAGLYRNDIAPFLKEGSTLLFAHGFNVVFNQISPEPGINVALVAPKGPGHLVRRVFTENGGVPALVAVHQDANGNTLKIALAYAKGIGCTRSGVLETTFKEETETDLFGEQTVLCGGLSALMTAGFETLVEAGYQPEIAYFECVHELKLIIDLIYEGGLANMRHSISNTAEYGDLVVGPRIITADTKARMKEALTRIQNGEFARDFLLENQAGRPQFSALRSKWRGHLIETTGTNLRKMMGWLTRNKEKVATNA